MLNSLPVRLLWHSLNWLTRLAIVASAAAAVLVAVAIIVLRYWLLPDIEHYHDKITASLSAAIGNPVSIARIEGDWQGFQPRLNFSDVRILDEQRQPALVLPRIDSSVSWMSLFTAELRLASLEIDRPELLVRRDVQGRVYIGGVVFSRQGTGNDLADWLLHQSRMVARNALIVWVDEQRAAPPLVLRQVDLRIESLFSHHRFALRAAPPEELATPLDLRGDFHGSSFDDLIAWQGQLFTQIDHTDITAWRPWLDLPDEFSRGRGALRGWLGIEGGRIAQITADLALRDVVTRLAADVPEMVLLNLRGRAEWKDVPGEKNASAGFEVATKRLAMRLQNGVALPATDVYLRMADAHGKNPASGEIRANSLQLETLASLANFVPLPARLRSQLDEYAPRGTVANLNAQWQGAADNLQSYKIKGQFDNLALRRVGALPGFSGLSADVDGSEAGGTLNIKSHQLAVDAPGVLREPLAFASLTGQAGWRRDGKELTLKLDNAAVSNQDLEGNVYGSYSTRTGTPGELDLTVSLTRGDVSKAARYTPLVGLDRKVSDWLHEALLAGRMDDLRIRIKGNLKDFPFDGNRNGMFELSGHARGGVVEFDKAWPRIENISGELVMQGKKLEMKSPTSTTLGGQLQKVTVTLPDMMSDDMPLEIRGEAAGATGEFLQFIQRSPVRGYIDGFTDDMRATGNGHLEIFVHVPLTSSQPAQVSGIYRVQDNDIDLGGGVPWLRKARGELQFTQTGVQAHDLTAEILGGIASLNLQSGEGGVMHATVNGHSNLDTLRKTDPHPLLNYLHGGAAWDADISVVKKSAQVVINSNMQGISSTLPQPFAKRANELLPLHIEKKNVAEGQDVITAQLGKLFSARLARRDENGASVIKRGVVNFGGQGKWLERDGVWLVGSLPVLSVQGWEDLAGGKDSAGPPLTIAGANLLIDKLTGYGLTVNGLRVDAARRGDGLAAQLSSSVLNGEVVWQPHGYETGGKLSGHLRNLQWAGDEQAAQPAAVRHGKITPGKTTPSGNAAQVDLPRPSNLPALEIAIENLQIKGKQLGRFELVGYPEGQDWRLRRLHITNPDGSVIGDGLWRGGQANAQTQVNLLMEISDAGKILARSGYPNTVKNGSGKLAAKLAWTGSPDQFNYATLDGTLKLDTGKGQFLKMDPGIGKLLSILSLQALPKRITLDFTDVFSGGFQFDNINGNATIRHGVMDTQDFHIDGSSAKVTMKGNVDLDRETQNLRVEILPTLGDSVSLIGAFAAGPVVGIGSLIINKVLGNPLDKLVSFEYNVSGTWSDPRVVKVEQAPVNPPETKPGK